MCTRVAKRLISARPVPILRHTWSCLRKITENIVPHSTKNEARRATHEALLLSISDFVECRIEKRLNRFVVEVRYHGRKKLAHINNTGRLTDLIVRGRTAACLPTQGKTDYRLFAVKDHVGWAMIDTQFQMRAFEKAAEGNDIPWLQRWRLVKRNPRLGESVLDYLFTDEEGTDKLYLETKSAVLRNRTDAMYPDCPTVRGQRHIRTLTEYARQGGKAAICFITALEGVTAFRPSIEGDPVVATLLDEAVPAQVQIRASSFCFDGSGIRLVDADLPVIIPRVIRADGFSGA